MKKLAVWVVACAALAACTVIPPSPEGKAALESGATLQEAQAIDRAAYASGHDSCVRDYVSAAQREADTQEVIASPPKAWARPQTAWAEFVRRDIDAAMMLYTDQELVDNLSKSKPRDFTSEAEAVCR